MPNNGNVLDAYVYVHRAGMEKEACLMRVNVKQWLKIKSEVLSCSTRAFGNTCKIFREVNSQHLYTVSSQIESIYLAT